MRALVTAMSLAAATPATAGAPVAMDGCLPGDYLLFFASGSAAISQPDADIHRAARARRLLDLAAFGWTRLREHITVTAHIDDAEAGRDKALGIRRADVVRNALVERNVPSDRIMVSDLGDTAPLLPHPDDPSEEQNRFVEVRLENVSNTCITEKP